MGEVHEARTTRRNGDRKARPAGLREHSIFIDGRPQPKERPRINRASGVIYTPHKTQRAESRIADTWKTSGGPLYPKGTQLHVYLAFDEDGSAVIVTPVSNDVKIVLRSDIDNLIKTVLDGLNGVAWEDDTQVVKVEAVKA